MTRVLWLLLAWLVATPLAFAEEAAAPEESAKAAPTIGETLEGLFGAYVVGPMATTMFFDLVFWDDTLPLGEGVGSMVGAEEVVSFSEADGYAFQARADAPLGKVELVLTEPRVERRGLVELSISQEGSAFVGRWAAGPLPVGTCGDLEACGVPLESLVDPTLASIDSLELGGTRVDLAEAVPTGAGVRVLVPDEGPPLVVTVSDAGAAIVAGSVAVDGASLPVQVGSTVSLDGKRFEVLSQEGDTLSLRGEEVRTSKDRLANADQMNIPLVVAWLVFGASFFTLRMNFINLRGLKHAVFVTAGHYDHPDDSGEITHFQALSSALSATVGLGNIAGVAIAVAVGGPGAVFWMVVAGFLGMSSKFTECTLGQMYRQVDDRGHVSGGPMWYLDLGLRDLGMGSLGKPVAVIFAIMCVGGSLGGGNMFQANQSFAAVADVVPLFEGRGWLYGILLAALVGMVILGGIKRIGKAASAIVPLMCGIYVLAALFILVVNFEQVPAAISHIVGEAFSPEAGRGGLIGVLVQGFRRAAFSNEAGVGSASIAHSAATTEEPVREGIVALLEPFIDTIVVCTMTGLVVVITGVYKGDAGDGVLMTSAAFATVIDWFPLVLSFAVVLFAFSTMISWSYYGERCATYLLGSWASTPYKILFLFCVFLGSVFNLGVVLDFSDLMILGMAFPNIAGLLLLSGKVKRALDDYWGRLQSGEMKPNR